MRGRPQPYLGLVTVAATTDLSCDVTTISPSADDLITARLEYVALPDIYIYIHLPVDSGLRSFCPTTPLLAFPQQPLQQANTTLTPATMTRTEVSLGRSTVLRG